MPKDIDTTVWPNTADWHALQHNVEVLREGKPWVTRVVDCGRLFLPSGKLVVSDPFVFLQKTGNAYVDVPPGTYPVKVTIADVSGEKDGSHLREAYASLILSDKPEAYRVPLTPTPSGTKIEALEPEHFNGFGVDAGTASMVDQLSIERGMPAEADWYEKIFDDGTEDSWFSQMDSAQNIREGLANIVLPEATQGENIVLFHSGWGDGVYPVIGGYSAEGELVTIHIDFLVL